MPVRHDPRTGKFMGGAGGFKASARGSGMKSPLAKRKSISFDAKVADAGKAAGLAVKAKKGSAMGQFAATERAKRETRARLGMKPR